MNTDAVKLSKMMCDIFDEKQKNEDRSLHNNINISNNYACSLKRVNVCIDNNWNSAIVLAKNNLIKQLKENIITLKNFIEDIKQHHVDTVDIKDIYLQIVELKQIFGDSNVECVCAKNNIGISCRTDRIVLEGVDLGRFDIILNIDNLSITIDPVDNNHASTREKVCHPHVEDGHICMGDAEYTIREAFKRFDILSGFEQLNNILHTYNPHSAYVCLEEWDGGCCCVCCNNTIQEDESCVCIDCNEMVCYDCCNFCSHCNDTYCRACCNFEYCEKCSTGLCTSCSEEFLETCCDCNKRRCLSCTNYTVCENCSENSCGECIASCTNCSGNRCSYCMEGYDLCEKCLKNQECEESTIN